jgi:hypothetical protein
LVKPQMVFYLDLNYWGAQYYESLTLPDKYEKTYVVECIYVKWVKRQKRLISAECPVFNCSFEWDAIMVYLYGCNFALVDGMVVITEKMLEAYPEVFQE